MRPDRQERNGQPLIKRACQVALRDRLFLSAMTDEAANVSSSKTFMPHAPSAPIQN